MLDYKTCDKKNTENATIHHSLESSMNLLKINLISFPSIFFLSKSKHGRDKRIQFEPKERQDNGTGPNCGNMCSINLFI